MFDIKKRPFSITASALGSPKRLYTKVLLVNVDSDDRLTAAYVNALWDTGADMSVMTSALASRLGYQFRHSIQAAGLLGSDKAMVGYAYVSMVADGAMLDTMAGIVDSFPSEEYSFIIGMDVIRKGSLAISSSGIRTVLSFQVPSSGVVDFGVSAEAEGRPHADIHLSQGREDLTVYRGEQVIKLLMSGLDDVNK